TDMHPHRCATVPPAPPRRFSVTPRARRNARRTTPPLCRNSSLRHLFVMMWYAPLSLVGGWRHYPHRRCAHRVHTASPMMRTSHCSLTPVCCSTVALGKLQPCGDEPFILVKGEE